MALKKIQHEFATSCGNFENKQLLILCLSIISAADTGITGTDWQFSAVK